MLCGQADSHDDKRTYMFTVDCTVVEQWQRAVLWRAGQLITMTAPNRNYAFKNAITNCIYFSLAQ
jgi:hypothetical protein